MRSPESVVARDDQIPAFINRKAGSAASIRDALEHDRRFEARDVDPHRISELIRAEAARGRRRVLICGGDGTIAAAVGAAVGSAIELAILPAGTLNHFARDYELPLDPTEALDLAATGTAQGIDVGVVNDRIMVNTASVGAYVDFVRRREARERYLGYYLASLMAAIGVLLRPRWVDVAVRASDGTSPRFHTPLLFVGVGEREFGGAGLGKRRPDGARALQVVVIKEGRRPHIAALAFGALFRGHEEILHSDAIDSHLVSTANVELRRPTAVVAVDGELVAMKTPLRFELKNDAVRLVRGGYRSE